MKKGMNLKKYKKTMIIRCAIGCGIFSLLAAGFASYFVLSGHFDSFKNDQKTIKHVATIEDLQTINLQKLNDIIILDNDLVLEEDFVLGSQNKIFEGEFYGNGHSITFTNTITTPFIYQIGEEGSVSDVEIIYENALLNLQQDFGGITLTNYGKISNCKVDYDSRVTIESANSVGGVVAYNYGSIDHCLSIVNFDDNNQLGLLNVIAGGIAGFNNGSGSIQNCVSHVRSEYISNRYSDIITGKIPVPKLGGIIGGNKDTATVKKNYCNASLTISADYINEWVTYVPDSEIKGKAVYETDKAAFDAVYWSLSEEDYPSLNQGYRKNQKGAVYEK